MEPPDEHDKTGSRMFRPSRTTKMKTKRKSYDRDSPITTSAGLPLNAGLADTEVSLVDDRGKDFTRTKTSLIWSWRPTKWPSGCCRRNSSTEARSNRASETATSRTSSTLQSGSKASGQKTTEVVNNNCNPMISINFSESLNPTEEGCSGGHRQTASRNRRGESDDYDDDDDDDDESRKEDHHLASSGSDSLVCSVENVRSNFIRLIQFNKYLYFYLATLIYSVINLGLIIHYLTNGAASEIRAKLQPQVDPQATVKGCRSIRLLQQHQALTDEYLHKLVKWFLLPAICILVIATILIIIEFNLRQNQSKLGRTIYRVSQTVGQIVSLMVFNLPFALFIIHQLTVSAMIDPTKPMEQNEIAERTIEKVIKFDDDDHCDNHRKIIHESAKSRLSLGALLGLLYLQPFFIQDGGLILNARIICMIQILTQVLSIVWLTGRQADFVPVVSVPANYSESIGKNRKRHLESSALVGEAQMTFVWHWIILTSLTLVPVLIFSSIRRYQFRRLICRDTFAGAGDLIEAKVSLEHQRQQQETLLLSVLPAYVAEQVKRNMLKKTNESASGLTSHGIASVHQLSHEMPAVYSAQSSPLPAATHSPLQRSPASHLTLSISSQQDSSPSMAQSSSTCMVQQSTANKSIASSYLPGPSPKIIESSVSLQSTQKQQQQQHHYDVTKRNLQAAGRSVSQVNSMNIQQTVNVAGQHPGSSASGPLSTSGPSPQLGAVRRGFNELYIRTYNNVSLLYGDIVGFTRLCTQLSSSQLVRVLNGLFSHFDHLAERHKIMRIKILGDCYYGVSGIPEFAVMGAKSRAIKNENHAINCVNMGLDMINYIRCFNVERSSTHAAELERRHELMSHSMSSNQVLSSQQQQQQSPLMSVAERRKGSACSISGSKSADDCSSIPVEPATGNQSQSEHDQKGPQDTQSPLPVFELNMRIGVHSGHIHSGVIGLKKWQFDVWSNDVSIAMHCESSGTAGRVQVTEATVQQLNGAFSLEEAKASERDSFLATKGIKTYLIKDKIVKHCNLTPASPMINTDAMLQKSTTSGHHNYNHTNTEDQPERANKRQQQRLRLLKDSMEKAEKDLMLDEDKIRAATIGTIRQTLLAGETCNSSGCNSIGLALDHSDLKPIRLNFRDPIIGKLYKNRIARSLAHESTTILILLLILLPLIDYQLLVQPDQGQDEDFRERIIIVLITVSAICVSLLVIGALWPRARDPKIISDHGSLMIVGSHHNKLTRNRSTSKSRSGRSNNSEENPSVVLPELPDSSLDQYHANSSDMRPKLFSHVLEAFQGYYRIFSRCMSNPVRVSSSSSLRTNKLRSMTVLSILFIVISLQNYLILESKHFCPSIAISQNGGKVLPDNRNDTLRRLISVELYHLVVIFVSISLDASVNLLGYESKSVILIMIICMNVLFTFESNPLPAYVMNYLIGIVDLCQNGKGDKHVQVVLDQKLTNEDQTRGIQELIDWSAGALISTIALLSLAYVRQLEYTNRANFLWRNRLNVDHEELEYISGINKVLLENILPSHVVEHYMSNPGEQPQQAHQNRSKVAKLQNYMRMSFSNMRNSSNDLYHEQHESVAVMFASIPHFYEFYDESDISKQGLGCIALLNEIICDFDKLLLKNKFSRIEKIKTIGSTYMAAAGLRPSYGGRNSTFSAHSWNNSNQQQACLHPTDSNTLAISSFASLASNEDNQPETIARKATTLSQQKVNLICMIQFATSLMSALNGINKQSFQGFKLRVGVNSGSVIAGIIGAQRPFYDIWGDCVNIASRMDSLGETGRIQVEEKTAQLLMESLCTDTYSIVRRGPIEVKGKGGMVTYFVDKKEPQQRPKRPNTSSVGLGASGTPVSVDHSANDDKQMDLHGTSSIRNDSKEATRSLDGATVMPNSD